MSSFRPGGTITLGIIASYSPSVPLLVYEVAGSVLSLSSIASSGFISSSAIYTDIGISITKLTASVATLISSYFC